MPDVYFPDDHRLVELAPRAQAGDRAAIDEVRAIYDRGQFDPGFGREIVALLGQVDDASDA